MLESPRLAAYVAALFTEPDGLPSLCYSLEPPEPDAAPQLAPPPIGSDPVRARRFPRLCCGLHVFSRVFSARAGRAIFEIENAGCPQVADPAGFAAAAEEHLRGFVRAQRAAMDTAGALEEDTWIIPCLQMAPHRLLQVIMGPAAACQCTALGQVE